MFKKTIVLDFDGVIHRYSSGWKGSDVIPDGPVDGAKAFIDELRQAYKVVVVSSRCKDIKGIAAIQKWLFDNDIEVDQVTADKVPAICYVDDRAVFFDGNFSNLKKSIDTFEVWYGDSYRQPEKLTLWKCNTCGYSSSELHQTCSGCGTWSEKTRVRVQVLELGYSN